MNKKMIIGVLIMTLCFATTLTAQKDTGGKVKTSIKTVTDFYNTNVISMDRSPSSHRVIFLFFSYEPDNLVLYKRIWFCGILLVRPASVTSYSSNSFLNLSCSAFISDINSMNSGACRIGSR
jgi:hypothetical protein